MIWQIQSISQPEIVHYLQSIQGLCFIVKRRNQGMNVVDQRCIGIILYIVELLEYIWTPLLLFVPPFEAFFLFLGDNRRILRYSGSEFSFA